MRCFHLIKNYTQAILCKYFCARQMKVTRLFLGSMYDDMELFLLKNIIHSNCYEEWCYADLLLDKKKKKSFPSLTNPHKQKNNAILHQLYKKSYSVL